jgi:uncharacterized metal-binding protein
MNKAQKMTEKYVALFMRRRKRGRRVMTIDTCK